MFGSFHSPDQKIPRHSLVLIPLWFVSQGPGGSLALHPGRISPRTGAPWPLLASEALTQQAMGQGAEAWTIDYIEPQVG